MQLETQKKIAKVIYDLLSAKDNWITGQTNPCRRRFINLKIKLNSAFWSIIPRMSGNTFGQLFRVTTYGESHGDCSRVHY